MTTIELTRASEASSRRGFLGANLPYLGGRRGLIAAGAAIVVAGLAFNWSWLVAAGIAPALLSLLPCAAMCALGLCMNRMAGGTNGVQQPATDDSPEGTGPLHLGLLTDEAEAPRPTASVSEGQTRAGCCQTAQ